MNFKPTMRMSKEKTMQFILDNEVEICNWPVEM